MTDLNFDAAGRFVDRRQRDLQNLSPAAGVIAALRHGRSTTLQCIGDSTGDSLNPVGGTPLAEWFEVVGTLLGQRNPTFNVLHRRWNDTNKAYDPYTVDQTSTSGERFANFNVGGLVYTAASVVGDIQITARVKPTTWSAIGTIASKYDPTGNQRGFQFGMSASGKLTWIWSANGTAATTTSSTVAVPFADGTAGWVRVQFDVDNGATGNTASFFTSTDGVTWTALGTPVVTAAVTSIFNNSSTPYQIGSYLGASLTSPFAGGIGWVEIENGFNGAVVAPPMPEDWDQVSGTLTDTVLMVGGPNLLLNNGSQSGQAISYFTTNVAKMLAPHGQDVLFLSTGHNETSITIGAAWITTYSTFVNLMKSTLPGVPVVCVTQNPTTSPVGVNAGANRSARGVALAAWVRSQAGVFLVDTYPAFTDLASQINSDGLHPNPAGSAVWAAYVDAAIFAGS